NFTALSSSSAWRPRRVAAARAAGSRCHLPPAAARGVTPRRAPAVSGLVASARAAAAAPGHPRPAPAAAGAAAPAAAAARRGGGGGGGGSAEGGAAAGGAAGDDGSAGTGGDSDAAPISSGDLLGFYEAEAPGNQLFGAAAARNCGMGNPACPPPEVAKPDTMC